MSQSPAGSTEQYSKILVTTPTITARELAVSMAYRHVSERGHGLKQYIQGLYASGAKMWTKDMFRDMEAELAKEPMPGVIMIRSMNGTLRRKQVPTEGPDSVAGSVKYLYVVPHFRIYQELMYNAEEETTELDSDEPYPEEIDEEDDKSLLTRALTLVRTDETSSTIDYLPLKAAWDEAVCNWNKSSVCSEMEVILRNEVRISASTKRIVCFGLGSLEGLSQHSDLEKLAKCDDLPLRRAMTQHAAALTIAAFLGEQLGTGPLPILAQDPAYSLVAKQLLTSLGIQVVSGRGALGFTYVDEESVVFSCHPNIPVKQIIADIARPAAMIWDEIKPVTQERADWVVEVKDGREMRRSPWLTDQDSPRTRGLIEEYSQYEFPRERERFGDLKIYIRKD